MPIRFRCAYCNQLMGISRRKAGTVVKCPNCAGQVVVPNDPEEGDAGPPSERAGSRQRPEQGGNAPEALFERQDFDEAFLSAAGGRSEPPAPVPPPPPPAQAPGPPPRPKQTMPAPGAPGERPDYPSLPPPQPPGILLSPAMATLLSVVIVVALALAFTAGLLVGRLLVKGEEKLNRREPPAYGALIEKK